MSIWLWDTFTFVMLQIIFEGIFDINSMQISNRANGYMPQEELNKDLRLIFSDGYTTQGKPRSTRTVINNGLSHNGWV